MALVKCLECGSEVSTEATACPKCGSVKFKPRKTAPAVMGLAILLAFGCCVMPGLLMAKSVLFPSAEPEKLPGVGTQAPVVAQTPPPQQKPHANQAKAKMSDEDLAWVNKQRANKAFMTRFDSALLCEDLVWLSSDSEAPADQRVDESINEQMRAKIKAKRARLGASAIDCRQPEMKAFAPCWGAGIGQDYPDELASERCRPAAELLRFAILTANENEN